MVGTGDSISLLSPTNPAMVADNEESVNLNNTLTGQVTLDTHSPIPASTARKPLKCAKCSLFISKDAINVSACIYCNEFIRNACIAKASKSTIVSEHTVSASLRSDSPLIYCCDRCRPILLSKSTKDSSMLKAEIAQLKLQITELTRKLNIHQMSSSSAAKRTRTDSFNGDLIDLVNDVVKPIIANELASLKTSIQEIASVVKKTSTNVDIQPQTPFDRIGMGRRTPSNTADNTPAFTNNRNKNKNKKSTTPIDPDLNKLTFAEVLNSNNESRGRFINIRVEEPTDITTINSIQSEQITKSIKVYNIKSKSPNYISVECQNDSDALRLSANLNNKYADKLSIEASKPAAPMVKVTNLPPNINKETILSEIIDYNYWLEDADCEVDRVYKINNGKRVYCNVILKCDLNTQKSILQKGAIMFGLKERYAFEYINLMQCARCLAFGHSAGSCKRPCRCKKCAGDHAHADCSSDSVKCINCTNHNKKSTDSKYDTAHIASSDHCKCRTDRINGLKAFHANKQKN